MIQGHMDGSDAIFFRHRAKNRAERGASEGKLRDFQACTAKHAVFHIFLS
jgi:hypothetical protein